MSVTELGAATVGLATGVMLGVVFFGGLWWTVRRVLRYGAAGWWFVCSYLIRLAVIAAGLYVISHDNPVRGVAAGLGLVLTRFAVTRRMAFRGASGTDSTQRVP